MWDDEYTLHQTKVLSGNQLVGLIVTPKHHRLGLVGGSFSSDFLGPVLRGEVAYYNGKYYSSTDPTLSDGVVKKNYIHYLSSCYKLYDSNLSPKSAGL